MKSKRVGFVYVIVSESRCDMKLVGISLLDLRNEGLPDTRTAARVHRMTGLVPSIEVSHDVDVLGVRRPYGEIGSGLAPQNPLVCAKFFKQPRVGAFVE